MFFIYYILFYFILFYFIVFYFITTLIYHVSNSFSLFYLFLSRHTYFCIFLCFKIVLFQFCLFLGSLISTTVLANVLDASTDYTKTVKLVFAFLVLIFCGLNLLLELTICSFMGWTWIWNKRIPLLAYFLDIWNYFDIPVCLYVCFCVCFLFVFSLWLNLLLELTICLFMGWIWI
jgi:hypothetical protein